MSITRAVASSIAQGPSTNRNLLAGNPVILSGSYESIATVTVGTSVSSISFSSIPSTYKHLQIRYSANSSGGGNPSVRFNGDSGNNYTYHIIYGQTSSAISTGAISQSSTLLGSVYSTANVFAGGVIDILDYANTNKTKVIKTLCGADTNSSAEVGLFSGLWNSTSAINSVTISLTNFTQYSSFALYGIK